MTFAALALAAFGARAINHDTVVAPIAHGPFNVACSNIAQDPALIAQFGSSPQDFWEGRPADGQLRYISQILAAPGTALRFDVLVPDLRSLYPQFAGEPVDHVAIVCHPTPASNDDPHYVLPGTGELIPHMQPAGAAPKPIGASEYAATLGVFVSPVPPPGPAKLPMVVFSHGLGGSPISSGYIGAITELASQGFLVGAVFHGDARISRIRIEDLGDFVYLLTDFDRFVEMELIRPLSLKAMVDVLLAHPQFGTAIDTDRIGGFGASLGGQAMLNLIGARLTTSIGLACRETTRDSRIKAAVGLVPYAGQTFLPAFCDDQNGADDVSKPFLALSGTMDTTAPIKMMEQALNRFGSSRYLVELFDVPHEFKPEYAGDVFTWTVTFLRAYLGGPEDPGAMARLIRMQSVAGGPRDNMRVDVHVPFAPTGDANRVVEFYNDSLSHYFLAAGADEIAYIAAGGAGPGWERTGLSFKAFTRIAPDLLSGRVPVCRFYGVPSGGPNSHFFTASAEECELVKRSGGWFYEGIGFYIEPVGPDGRCGDAMLEVQRAYNNGFSHNDSNHRFTTSDSTWREMERHGWTLEGAVMCARP